MTREELDRILAAHKAWLNNEPGGNRANLSKANLSKANLSGADLSGAATGKISAHKVGPRLWRFPREEVAKWPT